MAAAEGAAVEAQVDRAMVDIRCELVLRVAHSDSDEHRDIYDSSADH